jgi:hypothetical protein
MKINATEAARQTAKESGNNKAYAERNAEVRELYKQYAYEVEGDPCRKALRCVLIPYGKIDKVKCPKQTGDHLVENATVNHLGSYDINKAPTALVEGPSYHIGTHGLEHQLRTQASKKRKGDFTLEVSADVAATEHCKIFPQCEKKCIAQQLVTQHDALGIVADEPVKKPNLNSHHNEVFKSEWLDTDT